MCNFVLTNVIEQYMRLTIYCSRWLLALALVLGSLSLSAQTSKRRVVEHEVQPSETVYSIAQRYATTVDKVYELNPWARKTIRVGDKLLVATGADYHLDIPQKPLPANGHHTIAAGETLYRIARTYGVSVEGILRANPGITPEHIVEGMVLRIPTPSDVVLATPSAVVTNRPVRVLLMLPLVKTPRYLEFYQGFLMGMNDLKKDGISIHLTVLDVDSDEAVATHVSNGVLQSGYDFVIGGVTEEQIERLARATRLGYYIVPFTGAVVGSPRTIQLNQPPMQVVERVARNFVERYGRREVYFVQSSSADKEELLVQHLKQELTEAGINYRLINLSRTTMPMLDDRAIVVPVSADKALGEQVFSSLDYNNSQTKVFGYPQWQSYGEPFLKRAHKYETTIYSTFYFDMNASESKQFVAKFYAWYSTKLSNSFPKYGVLGYDVARYFIRANALLGNDFIDNAQLLSADGLQLDIELERSREHQGYVNKRFYFITFGTDGTVSRLSL